MEQSVGSQYVDLRSMLTLAGKRPARMGSTTWYLMSGWHILQQKRRDPVKPQSLQRGRLRVGKPSDVDAARGAEPLHHQLSHRVLLVDHSVANSP